MRKYKKQKEQRGLRIDVRNNNVEGALKILKRKIKDSGLILELKKEASMKNHQRLIEKRKIYKN
tara:strand:+ start:92 stop:283 length:192 start_codon:yes stop_codon:yes gene_type:complete